MRVLILVYSYAPVISPRAFRWSAIAEHWAMQGIDVDIVCARRIPRSPRNEFLKGVHVYRLGGSAARVLRRWFKRPGVSSKRILLHGHMKTRRFLMRQQVKYLTAWIHDHTWKKVYWPDSACFGYFAAFRKAKQLMALNQYETLISVSLPFTEHLVGLSLKRRFPGVYWLVDVGDPFCFLDSTPPNNFSLYKKLNHYIERKVLEHADAITVTTNAASEKYGDLFPESAEKIHVIPPLLSLATSQLIENYVSADDKIRLVFVGTLYRAVRNPKSLLNLYAKLLQTELAGKLELHFFGNTDDCQDCFEPYESLLGNRIFLHGVVSHEKALQAMKGADILVNIGNNTPYQLPSKVVEYASTGKPVLNLSDRDKDSSTEFFEGYPASLCLSDKAALNPDQLDRVIQFIRHPPDIKVSMLQQWLEGFKVEKIALTYRQIIQGALDER